MTLHLLEIHRLDGETLELDVAALADEFFAGDPSSIGVGAFDALAGRGDADVLRTADISAINRTMRARSPHAAWEALVDGPAAWLEAIPLELDLIELDDAAWSRARGDSLCRTALEAVIGPHRGLAVATKVLHVKRPRLFPVLDRFAAEMLGQPVPDGADPARSVAVAVRLVDAVRRAGRGNLEALRAVQVALAIAGVERSLVRVLDAAPWFAHKAAGVAGAERTIRRDRDAALRRLAGLESRDGLRDDDAPGRARRRGARRVGRARAAPRGRRERRALRARAR